MCIYNVNLHIDIFVMKFGNPMWFCDSFRYEKSSEYEKDKRIRNITNSAKQRSNKEETTEEKENRRN